LAPKIAAPRVVNIDDLRRLAQRRLPRMAFDYIDGGSDYEVTLRENSRAFDDVLFRPKNAVATAAVSLETTVVGTPLDLPIMLAPAGMSRLFYPRGEEAVARAAGEAGTAYILSTFAGMRLEDVKAATRGPMWYQLYLAGSRDVAKAAIARAKAAGYTALVVTIDTAVAGYRTRDIRNGANELLSRNPLVMYPYVWQVLSRPRWLASYYADGGSLYFPNVVIPGKGPMAWGGVAGALADSTVAWADLEWIRDVWDGPVVVKGVYTADDARRAVDEGAVAVIVSNHGGRQLDGVAPAIRMLPEVVAAVGDRTEVLFDSGIRRGSDIAKALCLGARAVLIGRAYLYGVAAAGSPGVARSIEILRDELTRTLKLLGVASIAELGESYVEIPESWRR
jgi:isopentenyl diphosphate isomerase/L-lactate dehydrogenase-like FMN-dependent dehydrogenase